MFEFLMQRCTRSESQDNVAYLLNTLVDDAGDSGGIGPPLGKFCLLTTFCLSVFKPGSHERHKHKINTKTKHDISCGTREDKAVI